MTQREPLRLTVAGPDPVVVELDPTGLDRPKDIRVRQLPVPVGERAAGERRFEAVVDGWVLEVSAEPARRAALRDRASRGGRIDGPARRHALTAQIPGRVVRVWVAAGDTVEAGQRLLAVEAMKMENEVRSPRAGTVEAVPVVVGQTVELGDELVVVS